MALGAGVPDRLPVGGEHLPTLEFRPPGAHAADEAAAAKTYFGGLGVQQFYLEEVHWAGYVAERVLEFQPASVLEFGCNRGRNLLELRKRDA